jgi:hypothetical protein
MYLLPARCSESSRRPVDLRVGDWLVQAAALPPLFNIIKLIKERRAGIRAVLGAART